jgi:hypothetical protein
MVVLENARGSRTKPEAAQNTKRLSNTGPTHTSSRLSLNLAPVFILCEKCYWCATYLDTNRMLKEDKANGDDDNSKICPRCDSIDCLSSIPILPNESFSINYTLKRGLVLHFTNRAIIQNK